jgi:proteasome lid subunit RPN8/RPN11
MDLILSRALADAICAHARAEAPQECCGLLLGDAESGVVESIAPAANVAAAPEHRFEIDPVALLAAYKARRKGGPSILGHYHSHPTGRAIPSATDAAMAEGRGEAWLIIGADGEMQGWRAHHTGSIQNRFEPMSLDIRD